MCRCIPFHESPPYDTFLGFGIHQLGAYHCTCTRVCHEMESSGYEIKTPVQGPDLSAPHLEPTITLTSLIIYLHHI